MNRSGISNLTGLAGAANIQGEDQKKLDVVSNTVFCNALRASGRTVRHPDICTDICTDIVPQSRIKSRRLRVPTPSPETRSAPRAANFVKFRKNLF